MDHWFKIMGIFAIRKWQISAHNFLNPQFYAKQTCYAIIFLTLINNADENNWNFKHHTKEESHDLFAFQILSYPIRVLWFCQD